MNSAMMPEDGYYRRVRITAEQAAEILRNAKEIISSVAYPEVCDLLYNISGVEVPLDVEKRLTSLQENKCLILVAKLRFRVKSERKGVDTHSIEDYEFLLIEYITGKR